MATDGKPVALAVKVALPVPVALAEKVTFCAVAKLAGVNVRVPPPLTERPVLPEVLAVVTVTLAVGAADREMPTVAEAPWTIDSEVWLAMMVGLPLAAVI